MKRFLLTFFAVAALCLSSSASYGSIQSDDLKNQSTTALIDDLQVVCNKIVNSAKAKNKNRLVELRGELKSIFSELERRLNKNQITEHDKIRVHKTMSECSYRLFDSGEFECPDYVEDLFMDFF